MWSLYLGLDWSSPSRLGKKERDSRRIGPCKAGNRVTWYQEGFYHIILTKEERAFRESFEISLLILPLSQPIIFLI